MINVITFNISCENSVQQISYWYFNNSTFNTSITGLLSNTTYTCCVLAVTSYGESEVNVRISLPVIMKVIIKSFVIII